MMDRRSFLRGVLAATALPVVEPARRAYSFIWMPPEPRVLAPAFLPDVSDVLAWAAIMSPLGMFAYAQRASR